MTTSQTLLKIAILAAGAVGRDLAPPAKSIVKAGTKKAVKTIAPVRWLDPKALGIPPKPSRRSPTKRPVSPAPKPAAPIAMYDAVTVANIPSSAKAVAGYMDGDYVTVPALKKRFRGLVRLWGLLRKVELITISVFASNIDADFLDVENGDATPEQAPGWVKAKLKRGDKRIGLYANRSTMPQLWALLAAAGIKRDQVKLWVADWTGSPHIPASYDACQWYGGITAGYDESLCLASFFD
jgi:hypothetical protein